MSRPQAHLVTAVRRAAVVAPSLTRGLWVTVLLAVLGTTGQVVVPVAIQQLLDVEVLAGTGDVQRIATIGGLALLAVVASVLATRAAMFRLLRAAAEGLAELRVATFAHVHRLSTLHLQSERRGSLVARVTSDIEVITQFVEWGGIGMLVGSAQLALVLVVMTVYDPLLAGLIALAGLLYALLLLAFQRVLRRLYDQVRERSAAALSALSEAISGLKTIRAYGAEARTLPRVDQALEGHRRAEIRAQLVGASMFSSAELFAGSLTAMVIAVGVLLQPGQLTAGRLIALLFLVTLFIEPIQLLVEVLNEAQTAAAGIRRVLGVLDAPVEVVDPVPGRQLPPGPLAVSLHDVWFAYPRDAASSTRGDPVLREVDLELPPGTRVAVVGETGSGKSTFVKLLTRLFDPTRGTIELSGVPLDQVAFASLRSRVISVPQEGFLFDASVADNIRYGAPGASDDEVAQACRELELDAWIAELPAGIHTQVGERGARLSAGERQLVALVRAWIARPDLLVLDEATSAVDPALEVRLRRAIERLTTGRTAITVAHRLSTAEAADEVLVFARGRVVERGRHADLVARGGVYSRLHADWAAGASGGRAGGDSRPVEDGRD
ncbi:MAG: ABC transporter ATP-binding protein [Nitriliruptoraceae bacterium]